MSGEKIDVASITEKFAAAAVDSSRWQAAMNAVSEATGSYGAVLFPIRGRLPNLPRSCGMEESYQAYVRDGWIHRDERYRVLPVMARRGVGTDLDFISNDEIDRHPYYQEFLRPFGLQWFAAVKVETADDLWCMSIQRSIAQGPFSVGEQEELTALSESLAAAAVISRALGLARAEAAADAFEMSGSAAVLLDRVGDVLRVNQSAERMLGSDVQIINKRLVSSDGEATTTLNRSLQQIIWSRTTSALLPPVQLPRARGRPLLAYPARLAAVSADALAPCQAVVILVDLEQRFQPPEETLRSYFGLTGGEAKLATRFASGDSLEHVADQLGIAKETARSRLKSIFEKTGVHRQSELVALQARLLNPKGMK